MNFMEGVQVDFQKLANDWISLETVEDYEHVIARFVLFVGMLIFLLKGPDC
jgi:hypothetical protein